ncbi:MAG TPA: hypothetical protein VNY84_07905 [Acidimicrobiales bacterium]|jgi:hypothetical protein|nr:hypothetical protein [Acidimicrobiales bacterium]
MAENSASDTSQVGASLADKYRSFLEGLSMEEFALYRSGVVDDGGDVEGFSFNFGSIHNGPVPNLGTVFQDVTVNKAKTADKAFTAMDGYIKM